MSTSYHAEELISELQERVETRDWGRQMVEAYVDVLGMQSFVPSSIWKKAGENDDRLKKYPR
jgi:hypothetical protein